MKTHREKIIETQNIKTILSGMFFVAAAIFLASIPNVGSIFSILFILLYFIWMTDNHPDVSNNLLKGLFLATKRFFNDFKDIISSNKELPLDTSIVLIEFLAFIVIFILQIISNFISVESSILLDLDEVLSTITDGLTLGVIFVNLRITMNSAKSCESCKNYQEMSTVNQK